MVSTEDGVLADQVAALRNHDGPVAVQNLHLHSPFSAVETLDFDGLCSEPRHVNVVIWLT